MSGAQSIFLHMQSIFPTTYRPLQNELLKQIDTIGKK